MCYSEGEEEEGKGVVSAYLAYGLDLVAKY